MPDNSTGDSPSSQSGSQPQPQSSSGSAQQGSTRSQTTQPAQKSQSSQPSRDLQSRQSSGTLQRRPALPFGGTFPLSPFSFMRRMLEDLDRTFEDFGLAGDLSGATPERGTRIGGGLSTAWSPAIEVLDRDGQFVIRAELPGLSPDDVRIEIADGSLSIEGERRSEMEAQEKGGVYRTERIYGRFARTLPLPDDVDTDRAQARFENGVLEISLPRSAPSQRRRIEIQRQSGSGHEGPARGGPMH